MSGVTRVYIGPTDKSCVCAKTGLYVFRTNLYSDGETAYTVHFWDIKLEEGDTPTDVN